MLFSIVENRNNKDELLVRVFEGDIDHPIFPKLTAFKMIKQITNTEPIF